MFGALLLGGMLAAPVAAASSPSSVTISDAAGDAVFGESKYHAPPPEYLDLTSATIAQQHTTLHLSVVVNATIPSTPTFNASYDHLGIIFGIQTNAATASSFGLQQFKEKTRETTFNWLVGILYTNSSDGAPIVGLGWQAWLLNASSFVATPLNFSLTGNTYATAVDLSALGNPSAFSWLVISELDWEGSPEPSGAVLFADVAPDTGMAAWP